MFAELRQTGLNRSQSLNDNLREIILERPISLPEIALLDDLNRFVTEERIDSQ